MKIAILTTDNREHFKEYDRPVPYFGMAPEALLQGLTGLPEVEVHVVSCTRQVVGAPQKIAPNIFFHSVVVPRLGWGRTGYWGCIRATRKQLQKIQPDIVHGQGSERDCALSAVFSGFPNVLTIHGNMNAIAALHGARWGSYDWCAARLEDLALPRAGGIICISDYVLDLVKRYGTPTWILPNAIQRMFFDFPRTAGPARSRPLLINVGVVSERKRQPQLLAGLAALRAQGLEFDTLFVGNAKSPYGEQFLAQLAAAEQKYGGFEHRSYLDNEDFCRLYDQAAAMIHFSNEESFGLTFAEAIARGLYLFASDVGAARAIASGVDGVQIFDLNAWDEMFGAMAQWLRAGGAAQPRPARPPQEFINRYYPPAVAQRHLEIYREVLARHQSGK